ncbi:hypothetical protein [Arthrobacter sp. SX1312]|uniref:hypothetical protein n=1 Tax=Arthrobacter sp. SX1312 TaxID=2058896 RepID=UPI000CE4F667|nr:hypothetical protein [Arthrobacter sp. SX1312]
MPAKTRNRVEIPVGSDPYNLTADLKNAFESALLTVPVENAAARDALAALFPNNTLPLNLSVARADLPGLIETWTGARWISNSGAIHLEIARTAGVNLANSLWGPGTPSELTAGVNGGASRNPSQFSFPVNNMVEVALEGIYALSWAVTDFSSGANGYITIRRDSNNQVLAQKALSNTFDVTAERPSIYLPAGARVRFNFLTLQAVECKHLLSITKIG